jgi:hypothetical protein
MTLTALALELQSQSREYGHLQKMVSQADAIRTTAEELTILRRDLNAWSVSFTGLQPYLPYAEVEAILEKVAQLHRRLAASRREFETIHDQARMLKQAAGLAETLQVLLKESWKAYAEPKVAPLNELSRIAGLLPAMENELPVIRAVVARLCTALKVVPKDAAGVDAFHKDVDLAADLLRDLRGLDPAARDFISKVQTGAATLADVTPEVLRWCQHERLSPLLTVRFG